MGAPHPHTSADVRFMQDMVIHHIQALKLSSLIRDRAGGPEMLLLGQRISVSQQDEIKIARRWLGRGGQGEAGPDSDGTSDGVHGNGASADSGHACGAMDHAMPAMLSAEQMKHFAAAS